MEKLQVFGWCYSKILNDWLYCLLYWKQTDFTHKVSQTFRIFVRDWRKFTISIHGRHQTFILNNSRWW